MLDDMNVIIYNINSFGGNYEYSKYIFKAYSKNPEVSFCTLLMPSNAQIQSPQVLKILHSDIAPYTGKLYRKLYYVFRSIANPFRLFSHLKKQPPAIVLFNDFDQLTAMIWAPFFKLLKNKHSFAVILHDPDRDDFFTLKYLSQCSMKSVMSIMNIAFYHGYLPDRGYYKNDIPKVKIPHGIYTDSIVDETFLAHIKDLADGADLIGILGNIRAEKNYESIIDTLSQLANTKLLIAGNVANSSVSVDYYKDYASKKGVADKVIWMIGYLSQSHFNAAIKASSIVLLYYKSSFTSQSGVLNSIAPFGKKLIISDAESSLKECVLKYNLGEIVPNNNTHLLVKAINFLLTSNNNNLEQNWVKYMDDSSWDEHISTAVAHYKKIINEF